MKQAAQADGANAASSVVEDYLQVLHYLRRDGQTAIAARLAERLNVTPPTVTATLQRMERDGLIEHGPHKEIVLTARGAQMAENIVRRHALAERLLTDLLKMPWHEAHEEAHGVEHALTPNIEARLMQVLDNPTTCPHGNPIPGMGNVSPDEIPLATAQTGEQLIIQRITEEAELDPRLMQYLQEHGVEPGAKMMVQETSPFSGLIILDGARGAVAIGLPIAAKIRVRRVPVHPARGAGSRAARGELAAPTSRPA